MSSDIYESEVKKQWQNPIGKGPILSSLHIHDFLTEHRGKEAIYTDESQVWCKQRVKYVVYLELSHVLQINKYRVSSKMYIIICQFLKK